MEITFKDITICETEGYFDMVQQLMESSTAAPLEKWMVESEYGVLRGAEDSYGVVQFWNSKECILKGYSTNFTSDYFPADLIFLYNWLKDRKWELIIDEDLRNSAPDFWQIFDQMIDDEEYVEEEIDYDDEDYDEELDFIAYQKKLQEYKKPKANKYSAIEELPEFESHKNDLKKRAEEENNSWF